MGKPTDRACEMKRLLEQFEASSLSRREFCEQQSIPISTLDYWRQRAQRKPRLVKVELAATEAAVQSFTLRLANGRSIDSCWRFDEEELARLIRVAERA